MKVTIQAGVYTYRVANDAVAVDGIGCFEKRLLNELSLVKSFSTAGTAPLSLSINIRNNDWYIPAAVDLWAASVVVEADNGHKWAGKVTAFDTDSGGVLYIIATEKTAPELSIQIPDEVARVVTLDEKFHVSALNVNLPYVLGGNVANPILVKGILIDKTRGIYLLAVGENHQFVKVYRGTEELATGFTAYVGTAGQAEYQGICYVQITDETLRKNDDGSYVEISADIVGLKLGSHTIEECRNGARQLLWLLKTAKDGGWGLGISESEINLDAFAESISRVDTAGLKSDGVMYFRQEAIGYIDQICKAIRGRYRINADGKRSLFVDAPAASVKTYSPALKNMKLLRFGKGAYTGRVFNKGRLEFGYNALTSIFMQNVSYQNSTSISAIEEQEFSGQSYFLRDMASAQLILDYTCKKSQTGAEKVFFEALELPENASDGQIITIDYLEKGISGNYQITHLEITDFVHTIEAERFSTDDFTSGPPGTAITWTKDPPVVSPVVPGVPSGLTLSSEVRPSRDGTNIVVIKGSFTPPAGSYIAASVEWGEGILPILAWNDLGLMQGNQFEIAPVKPNQAYAVRVRMITSTGKSSYITGTTTTQGDTVPPAAPSIGINSYLKTVTMQISLANPPDDMGGFAIYRHITNDSATAEQISSVVSKDGKATYTGTAPEYGITYYYWAKAVDTWGNRSSFSNVGITLITGINSADIVDGALARSELFASGVVNATAIAEEAVTASKTKLNAINKETGDLNANVVNTLQLNADAVTAEKVKSLSVLTRHLGSGAVTTEKLLVGAPGSALNDDPGFQDSTAWKYEITGLPTITTVTDGVAGNGVARSSTGAQAWFNSTRAIPLDQSKELRFRFWARRSADANGVLYGVVALFDSAGVNIEGAGSQWYYAPSAVIPGTAWTEYAAIVPAYSYPANARFIRPGAILNYQGTAGYMEIQDLRLEEVLPATLIQDGAVITPKIAAGAVVAAHVSAGAIETPALAAECVTAAKVDSTVVKTTELNVYGKNRCPDPAFDNVYLTLDYFDTGDQITANGSRVSAWVAYKYGFPSLFAKVMHKQFWGGHLFGGSNGLALYSRYGSNYYSYIDSKPFPVTKNAKYHASLYAKELNSTAGFGRVVLILVWLKSDLTSCSPSQSYAVDHAISTASLTRYSGTVTAPADAAFAIVRVFNSYPVSGSSSEDSKIAFSGIQVEEGETATAWVNREQGTVTAERVVAGELKSLNYSTIAGSLFSLDAGDLFLGGSAAPVFSFVTATRIGTISGFTFNVTDMIAGSASNAIGISTDSAKMAFWAGSEASTSAPFRVGRDGNLNAKKGTVGGMTLDEFFLRSTDVSTSTDYVRNTFYGNQYAHVGIEFINVANNMTQTLAQVRASMGNSTANAPFFAQLSNTAYFGFYTNGSIYVGNNCSAQSFTDRTEMPASIEEAEEIVYSMFAQKGKVNYKRLSNKAKHFAVQLADDGTEYIEEGRDLTKTVSALVMIVQKHEEIIIRLLDRVIELESEEQLTANRRL